MLGAMVNVIRVCQSLVRSARTDTDFDLLAVSLIICNVVCVGPCQFFNTYVRSQKIQNRADYLERRPVLLLPPAASGISDVPPSG